MNRQSRQHGFTLLEVILATAMVAILGLSLYSAMAVAFSARESARNQTLVVRRAAIAMDVIQQDLQSVPPPEGWLAGPFVGGAGGGIAAADSLEFCTIGRDWGDQESPLSEGMRWVELLLRTDVDPPVLVRRIERNLLSTVVQEPEEEPLVSNVRSFALRYFDGSIWVEEWDSTISDDTLPLAVEVTLELNEPSPMNAEQPYRVTQVIPLPCAVPLDINPGTGVFPE